MLTKCFKTSFIVALMLLTAFTCKSQVSATVAKGLAGSSQCVSNYGAPGKPKFARSTRNEKFEDLVFAIQKKNYAKKLTKAAFIFKVETTGTFITDSNRVFAVTGSDSKFIAVLKESGKVLGLYGCRKSKDSFQTLVKDAKVKLTSVSDADTFGYLYYKLVEDPDLRRIVFNRRVFRHEVENFFFDNFSEDEAKSKFRKWKRSYRSFNMDEDELGLTATKHNDMYKVSFVYVSLRLKEMPKLRKDVMLVSTEGDIKKHTKSILFN